MVRSQDFMTAVDKEQFMKLLNHFTDTRRYMVEERDAWNLNVPFLYMQFIEINNEYTPVNYLHTMKVFISKINPCIGI